MNNLRLVLRSMLFHRRMHLGLFLGSLLTSAVLTGALLVGDSAKNTLRTIALARLGKTAFSLNANNRFFNQRLAPELRDHLQTKTTCALLMMGIAITQEPDGQNQIQANKVQVLGITDTFQTFADEPLPALQPDTVFINTKLADKLKIDVGSEISVRINRPGLLPRDALLSSKEDDSSVRVSCKVGAILSDRQLGRFSLEANQNTPYSVFISMNTMQNKLGLDNLANIMLVQDKDQETITQEQVDTALTTVCQPEDLGITIKVAPGTRIAQIHSTRVFLEPAFNKLVTSDTPGTLTYLVNSISSHKNEHTISTPYSFMTAISPSSNQTLSPIPLDMKDNEILINQWLADQINVTTGDPLIVAYYELTPANDLVEQKRTFFVKNIIPMPDLTDEKELFPNFPGLSDVENCANWNIGMPMDKKLLEDQPNIKYWETYRTIPKAYITLAAGQSMWSNRFGDLTTIRFSTTGNTMDSIRARTTETITPSELGYYFTPIRQNAMTAVSNATDFGELFLSMSFFLILASLILTSMIFAFGIEQRSAETGVFIALGYQSGQIKILLMLEAGITALAGSIAGAPAGALYTRGILWSLANFWSDAVAGSSISYYPSASTMFAGPAAGLACAIITLVITLRRNLKLTAHQLLAGNINQQTLLPTGRPLKKWRGELFASTCAMLSAAGIIIFSFTAEHAKTAPAFFTAGALLLAGSIGFLRIRLVQQAGYSHQMSFAAISLRNSARRPGRSLAVTALIACGCFLVFAVSSMKEDLSANSDKRWSGTGGFELIGESTLPMSITENINILPVRIHNGDDASCFNLNRALSPRLLGVNARKLAELQSFLPEHVSENIWELLDAELPDGQIPGIAGDANTAMWGLQKKTDFINGDALNYTDEHGQNIKIKLIGSLPVRLSILQGNVLISAKAFANHFPSEDGFRLFLIDTPNGQSKEWLTKLSRRYNRQGLDITTSIERLRDFYSVETAYLSIFLMLGGLGLVLGTAGMGIVVMRNIAERRSELAILRAVGYSRRQITAILTVEHLRLLILGIILGSVSALTAMIPSLLAPSVSIPWSTLGALAGGITISGASFITAACISATKNQIVDALRNE